MHVILGRPINKPRTRNLIGGRDFRFQNFRTRYYCPPISKILATPLMIHIQVNFSASPWPDIGVELRVELVSLHGKGEGCRSSRLTATLLIIEWGRSLWGVINAKIDVLLKYSLCSRMAICNVVNITLCGSFHILECTFCSDIYVMVDGTLHISSRMAICNVVNITLCGSFHILECTFCSDIYVVDHGTLHISSRMAICNVVGVTLPLPGQAGQTSLATFAFLLKLPGWILHQFRSHVKSCISSG